MVSDNNLYLNKKHTGGANNKKGGRYEDFFATFQIVALMDKYADRMGQVFLSGQDKNAYVDDLLICVPDIYIYHQLKDVKYLTWNYKSSNHVLYEDFEMQKKECEKENAHFILRLVYSNEKSNVKDIPVSIKDCTESVLFHSAEDINACILANKDFEDALSKVSIDQETDSLINLGACILGIWCSSNQEAISLISVYKRLSDSYKRNIVLKSFSVTPVSQKCKEILLKIGVSFKQTGNLFSWSALALSGNIAWSEEIDSDFCNKNPQDIFDFLSIINQI